ncbi:saccharopine dehydrogenase family protein [Sorangium sp. So ce861]|uniref:saccharopine dehydrogenase family protein n=1 Tax=Sorangium sp. So ce861 TaxID=3133323 RepID=UPI003F5F5B95
MTTGSILVVGGYGEVGRRLAVQLEATQSGRVVVAGRHPERAGGVRARRIDADDAASIERALEGVGVVVACVRQREPQLLRAAVRRGIAYTSIAPPWMPWPEIEPLREQARRTGARVVLAAGLEPGITSVLVRAAADRLGQVDAIETALLLGLGDAYGADSMAFILEEVGQPYSIVIDGQVQTVNAFERSQRVAFPAPVGLRRAYTMPFTDQRYYSATLGAKTAVARIALDPPWLASVLSALLAVGLRRLLLRGGARGAVHGLVEKLRGRYSDRDHFALVVDVRGGGRMIRSTLVGRQQAEATATGASAVTEALWWREVDTPGVWLAEQIIAPAPFLTRLAAQGLVPVTEELSVVPPSAGVARAARDHLSRMA